MSVNPFKRNRALLFSSEPREFEVLTPPQSIGVTKSNLTKRVFLAGTIDMGEAENWQEKVISILQDTKGDGFFLPEYQILNPRRKDWDNSLPQRLENPQFFQQVTWELDAIEKADYIIMNFLPESKSPITLMELGLLIGKGRANNLFVVCPDEFYRSGNVHILCNKYDVPVYKTIEELLK